MGTLRRGDWARMYSGGYHEAARLRDEPSGRAALHRADREIEGDMADPWLADLGAGAWLQGLRDAVAGTPPRIELEPVER